jgi:beta-glucosidase
LQNRDAVLPIPPAVRTIAVIGPFATSQEDQLGPHGAAGRSEEAVTILDGVTERARASGISVVHAAGCDLYCQSADGFPAAIEAARTSDMVVAVLGEPRDLSGEGASRAHLRMPGRQYELLDALVATGKPIALVLMAGRPLELDSAVGAVSSILMAWYPGTEGGPAIADVLFGDANPSGKLPHTYPRTVGQVPIHYDRLPSGRPTEAGNRFTLKYIDEDIRPLFPFGWGLSYTRFAYSNFEIVTPKVRASEAVEIRVTVANTGSRAGKEVVQLYVRDLVASRSRPVRQLKAFEKIALAPSEARTVTFRVPARDLGFHLADGAYVVEPGAFQVWVGGSSLADLGGTLEVTEGLRLPPQ